MMTDICIIIVHVHTFITTSQLQYLYQLNDCHVGIVVIIL